MVPGHDKSCVQPSRQVVASDLSDATAALCARRTMESFDPCVALEKCVRKAYAPIASSLGTHAWRRADSPFRAVRITRDRSPPDADCIASWGQISDRQLMGACSLWFGRAFLPVHRSRRPRTSKWGRTLMNACSSALRSLLVVGTLGALLVAAALAQQTP